MPRAWVANKPEDRLSIATDRFLRRALCPPFYCVAIHDSDGGARSMQQRVRDANRGRKKGQLDWDVVQGPICLARKLELKRTTDPTEEQLKTIADLTACGAPPVVAYTLREVYEGLLNAGFRFLPNAITTLAHWEAELAGWDREAEAVLAGTVVRKASKPRAPRASLGRIRKAEALRSKVRF